MDNSNAIWLFGRKVKAVRNDNDCTCSGCALFDICSELCGCSYDICSTGDGSKQKFIKAE